MLTTFSNIDLISQLDISACPLVCWWYAVATLWCTLYLVNNLLMMRLKKCETSSLINALGVSNHVKMCFWRNLDTIAVSFLAQDIASIWPIRKHSQQLLRCNCGRMMEGKGPWSRFPKCQTIRLQELMLVASHFDSKYFQRVDNYHI